MNIESYVESLVREAMNPEPQREQPATAVVNSRPEDSLEAVLKGLAVELWSDALGERFWLVADETDAAELGEPRGTVYTASEARCVIQIGDPASIAEIHEFKRRFGVLRSAITKKDRHQRGEES